MVLDGFTSPGMRLFFSADSKSIAAVSDNGEFKKWNLQNRQPLLQSARKGASSALQLNKVALSPKLDWLSTIDATGHVQIWKTKDGSQLGSVGGEDKDRKTSAVTAWFDADGDTLQVLDNLGTITHYSVPSLTISAKSDLELRSISQAIVSENGSYLMLLADSRELVFVDLKSNTIVDRWRDTQRDLLVTMALSERQGRLAVGYSNGLIRCFKLPAASSSQTKDEVLIDESR
jgi:WD40 repeat protein